MKEFWRNAWLSDAMADRREFHRCRARGDDLDAMFARARFWHHMRLARAMQ